MQAVKADISDNGVTVNGAWTFNHEELDGYLAACRENTCIVCCNPSLFHQDIVHLPPAAGKFYDNLVRAEVLKSHPELTAFTLFYRTVAETTIDGVLYNKIAAFSYEDDSLSNFISMFSRHGKVISRLYAAPYPIFRLAASTCADDPARARIFIAPLSGEKLILLSENTELEFIRKIPSTDAALLPADSQNINMTVDYCFQSLRVRPSEAVILDPHGHAAEPATHLTLPHRSALPPALAGLPHDIVRDYLAPLAAALHYADSPADGDILPSDYVAFTRNKRLLAAATIVMITLALFLAGVILTERMALSDLKAGIAVSRTQLGKSGEEMAAFRKLDDETKALSRPIEYLNKFSTTVNHGTALASLTLAGSKEYSIRGLSLQKGEGFIGVRIEGDIASSSYGETQAIYEGVQERVRKIPGYSVTSGSVDVKQKTFSIEARYSGAARQGS
ncbi:MAG: hypothetical protein HYV06_02975 [Deltaproteobacteria bacterium]|nr:hypothetical protein [Deltaproteobacteria bacterium]